MIVFFS